jgi:hypothetical protein
MQRSTTAWAYTFGKSDGKPSKACKRHGSSSVTATIPRTSADKLCSWQCGFTSQVLYPPALGVIKLSIILFLLRVLPPDHSWTKRLYALAAWVVSSETAFTIALFLQCRPLNFYWDKTVEGTCFDQPKFYYVDAALNMATDVVILALPWFIFRSEFSRCQDSSSGHEVLTLTRPELIKKEEGGATSCLLRWSLVSEFSFRSTPSSRLLGTNPDVALLSLVSFACRTFTT